MSDSTGALAIPGEHFRVLASSSTLRKHLTDSYWCDAMDEVCDGKEEGVLVRYTGKNLAMVQFRPSTVSLAGYRYPLAMSIPLQYLVPVRLRKNGSMYVSNHSLVIPVSPGGAGTDVGSSLGSPYDLSHGDAEVPHLCVVCGRWGTAGKVRNSGFKCCECVGKKSEKRLVEECRKLKENGIL